MHAENLKMLKGYFRFGKSVRNLPVKQNLDNDMRGHVVGMRHVGADTSLPDWMPAWMAGSIFACHD